MIRMMRAVAAVAVLVGVTASACPDVPAIPPQNHQAP